MGTSHLLGMGTKDRALCPWHALDPRGDPEQRSRGGGTFCSAGEGAAGSVLPGARGPPCLPGFSLTRLETLRSAGALAGAVSAPCQDAVCLQSCHCGTGSAAAATWAPREGSMLQVRGGGSRPLPLGSDRSPEQILPGHALRARLSAELSRGSGSEAGLTRCSAGSTCTTQGLDRSLSYSSITD